MPYWERFCLARWGLAGSCAQWRQPRCLWTDTGLYVTLSATERSETYTTTYRKYSNKPTSCCPTTGALALKRSNRRGGGLIVVFTVYSEANCQSVLRGCLPHCRYYVYILALWTFQRNFKLATQIIAFSNWLLVVTITIPIWSEGLQFASVGNGTEQLVVVTTSKYIAWFFVLYLFTMLFSVSAITGFYLLTVRKLRAMSKQVSAYTVRVDFSILRY